MQTGQQHLPSALDLPPTAASPATLRALPGPGPWLFERLARRWPVGSVPKLWSQTDLDFLSHLYHLLAVRP